VPSIDEVEEKRSNQLFDSLKETLEKNEFKRQDALVDRLLDAGHSPTDIASALLHLLTPEKPKAEQIPDPRRRANTRSTSPAPAGRVVIAKSAEASGQRGQLRKRRSPRAGARKLPPFHRKQAWCGSPSMSVGSTRFSRAIWWG
jgi:ATP-dependent RNA helicase DeaD